MSDVERTADEKAADIDAGMAMGHSGVAPEEVVAQPAAVEPVAEVKAEPVVEAKPEEAPAKTPEELIEDRLYKRFDGRIRQMNGELNKFSKQLESFSTVSAAAATAATKDTGQAAPSDSQITAALQNGTKMKALMEDYPVWGEAMLEFAEIQGQQTEERILKKLPKGAEVDTSKFVPIDTFNALRDELFDNAVAIKFPDWEEKAASPLMTQFYATLSEEDKVLAASTKPKDGIAFMEKFYAYEAQQTKTPATPKPKPNNSRLESSVAPAVGANRVQAKGGTIDDGLNHGYKNAG